MIYCNYIRIFSIDFLLNTNENQSSLDQSGKDQKNNFSSFHFGKTHDLSEFFSYSLSCQTIPKNVMLIYTSKMPVLDTVTLSM